MTLTDHTVNAALGDRYEAVRLLATGGMGEVWLAIDTVLGREVACKVLKAEYAEDAAFRERFITEARNAAQLQHPGVASVFDFGERPGERPFLVMELVGGPPLTEALLQGPLAPEPAREVVRQVAEALGAAHAIGLVHRDVKPGNILLTEDRRVKLTDFGIARAADGVPLTKTGEIIGTPSYISPEQAEGRQATAASDVYALGCVLFECLTGAKPFQGDGPVATALAHLRQPVPELPDSVPADLAAVARRAMAKDPAERYPDGASMAAALRGAPEATQVLTMPPDGGVPVAAAAATTPWWRRRWPLLLAGLLALLLIGALAVSGLTSGNEVPDPAPTETPETVRVVASDYVGKDAPTVQTALQALGLKSIVRTRPNPGDQRQGTVAALSPTGEVAPNTVIALSVWGAPPPPPPASDDGDGEGDGDKGKSDDRGKSDDKGKSDDGKGRDKG